MKKFISIIFLNLILITCSSQSNTKKITTYFLTQYNSTISDRTKGNNPWGIGLGLQSFYNNKSIFKPTIELTSDLYFVDDKVFRMNSDGSQIPTVGGMINLFFGTSIQLSKKIFSSIALGPSYINSQTLFAIKPSLGIFLNNNHKFVGKISYIKVYKRDKITLEDFNSFSLAIGFKIS